MFMSTLTPPWGTFTTPGAAPAEAFAESTTGRLSTWSYAGVAMSTYNWAGVAQSFQVPQGTSLLTASVSLSATWTAYVTSFLGYSSAEALVTLWIWETAGFDRRGEHRLSLAHPVAPFIWAWWGSETGRPVQLAAATTRQSTAGGFAAAAVFVESWAGAGGLFALANATSRTTVPSIAVVGY
jgi:hypothetical protein